MTDTILSRTQFIENVRDCANLVQRLMNSAQPIAFDCEWIPDGIYNDFKITLLQISDGLTPYIFDVQTCPDLITHGNLSDLLESTRVVKVIHDSRLDRSNLKKGFNIDLLNVFDTQIAHRILEQQQTGKPFGQAERISLNKLYQRYGAPTNPQKANMRDTYKTNPSYWGKRPLTDEMKVYVASDVLWLLKVYRGLMNDLDSDSRQLMSRLTNEQDRQVLSQMGPIGQAQVQRVGNESSFFNSNLFWGVAGAAAAATCIAVWASGRNANNNPRR